MTRDRLLTARPDSSVRMAALRMADMGVGAVLVVEGRKLVGIFTERDAVFRVIAEGRDPEATNLKDVMTPDPKVLAPDDTFGYALVTMYENGFRHVPVVENGEPVGIVSARKALDPELEEFASESERRRSIRQKA